MKYFLLLAFLAVALAGTIQNPATDLLPFDDDSEVEVIVDDENAVQEIAPQFILSWQARRAIRRFQKQMPCGFPEYGVPPLAPLKKRELSLSFKRGALDTTDVFTRFRLDGLDKFKIKKFKLNMFTSKVTFDFNFRHLQASAPHYTTDTLVDLLSEFGVSAQYETDGALDFGLRNLRIAGILKYKLPVLFGSIKIKSLKVSVTLGSSESNITGLLGEGKLNELANKKLEKYIESSINDNQEYITKTIEETVVPPANKALKGNDFWTLLDWIMNSDDAEHEDDPIKTKCKAPKDPWA